MSERARCPGCKNEMPANAPQGLCPACLLRQAMQSRESPGSDIPERTPEIGRDGATSGDSGRSAPGRAALTEGAVGVAGGASQRFRVVRLHQRGGLGEVFLAKDDQLNRDVALKRIQERHADDPLSRARFLLEAEITGGLEHPGIVPIHSLGRSAHGRPYYIMRFIKGESLKEAIERFHDEESTDSDPGRRRLELRKLLGRFLDVCNAVAYAHNRGVIHRDLKPANVVLGHYGETLVVDWGLAKALGMNEGGDSEEPPVRPRTPIEDFATQPDSILGTPAYMSPEQASGLLNLLGPTSDVYSLGATLYTLLTGRAAYGGRDHHEVLEKARSGVFTRPRALNRSIPPALEAICLKAMERSPEGRYASPKGLAEDIEHWLADEPVSAWREPWRERMGRWARRHRAWVQAGAAALVAVAAVAMVAVGVIRSALVSERAARKSEELALQNEKAARKDEQAALKKEQEQRTIADNRRRESERLSARLAMERGMTYVNQGDTNRGLLWLAQALKLTPDDDRELDRFLRSSLTAWSQLSNRLKSVLAVPEHMDPTRRTALLSGRYLLIATGPERPQVWDVTSGVKLGELPVWGGVVLASGTGTGVLIQGDSAARLWDAATREPVGPPLTHPGSTIVSAFFSQDGSRLITSSPSHGASGNERDVSLRVWDAITGRALGKPLLVRGESLSSASFSPDGMMVIACTDDPIEGGRAGIWDLRDGTQFAGRPDAAPRNEVRVSKAPDGRLVSEVPSRLDAAFAPDGKTFATREADGWVQLWDAATRRPIDQPISGFPPLLERGRLVHRLRFSPDGKVLVNLVGTLATVLDARSGRVIGQPQGGGRSPNVIDLHSGFSPDGRAFFVIDADAKGLLIRLDTGQAMTLASPCGIPFTFSPDGRRLVTAGPSSGADAPTARIWDVWTGQPVGLPLKPRGRILAVAFHPDSRILITGDEASQVQLWNAETGEPQGKALAHPEMVLGPSIGLSIAADRKTLLVSNNPGARQPFWLWELGTAFSPRIIPASAPNWVWSQGPAGPGPQGPFSPGGRVFLTTTVGERRTYRMWDASNGGEIGPTEPIRDVLFRPDGKTALLLSRESAGWAMQHWDIVSNRPRGPRWIADDRDLTTPVAWQPDGRAVLLGDPRSVSFCLVDPDTGRRLGPKIASIGARTVRFRDDGKSLLVVENDGTARILDPTTGDAIIPPCPGAGDTIDRDGRTYLARTKGGSLQLWNALTLEPLIPPIQNPYDRRPTAAVSPDGRVIMTIHPDKNRIRLWETATGKPIGAPDGPINRNIFVKLERAEFAPGGKVVYGLWSVEQGSRSEIRTWEAANGRPLGTVPFNAAAEQLLGVRPDGKVVALFDPIEGELRWRDVAERPSGDPGPTPARRAGPNRVRLSYRVDLSLMSPDGTRLFTERLGKGQLWDVAARRRIGKEFESPFRSGATGRVLPMAGPAFSPDGRLLVVGSPGGGMAPRVVREQIRLNNQQRRAERRPEEAFPLSVVRPPGAFQIYDAVTGEPIGKPAAEWTGADLLAFSADGSTLVAASSDGTAQAWSVARRQPIGPVLAHDDPITAIAPSPDGKSLLVLTNPGPGRAPVAHYWDVVSGKPLGPPLDPFEVLAVGFGANGIPLVFGNGSEILRIIEASSRQPIGQPIPLREGVRQVDLSPDGTALLTHCGTILQIWDARTGRPRGGAIAQVGSVRFTPEGLVLVTMIDDGEGRQAIQLRSPRTGEPLAEPAPPPGQGKVQAVSASGRKALILGKDGSARIWDLAGGGPIGESIDLPAPLDTAAFSPEDSLVLVATADGTGRFWDVATAHPLGRPFPHTPTFPITHSPAVREFMVQGTAATANGSVTFSPDGRILAHAHPSDPSRTELLEVPAPMAGSPERIALWSQIVAGLELEPGRGTRQLDAASVERIRRRLESLGGTPEPSRKEAGAVAVPPPPKPAPSPPGNRPAPDAGSSRPDQPRRPGGGPGAGTSPAVRPGPSPPRTPARSVGQNTAWKPAVRAAAPVDAAKPGSAPIRASLSGTAIESSALIFTPDSTRVIGIGMKGSQGFKWFDARTGEEIPAGVGRGCPRLDGGGSYPSLAISPDGRQLALGGLAHSVQVWDMATEQKRPQREPTSEGVVLSYSADGERLIAAGQFGVVQYGTRRGEVIRRPDARHATGSPRAISPDATRLAILIGGEIEIRDVPEGRKLLTIERLYPRAAAFSPDNRRLVTAQGSEAIVKVWDLDTGKDPLVLDDHTRPVWSVAFSPDGRYIATAGEDGRAKVWDAKTGAVAWSFDDDSGKVTSVAFSPDGRRLVALNGQGRLRIWGAEEWAR